MIRRIPVHATLLLAAFLVGRWYVDTEWTTETIQAVAAGHVSSTAAAAAADLPADLDLRTVTRVVDGDTLHDHGRSPAFHLLRDVPQPDSFPDTIRVVVEISAGSKEKREIDAQSGKLFLDRVIEYEEGYPANYGSVPGSACLRSRWRARDVRQDSLIASRVGWL